MYISMYSIYVCTQLGRYLPPARCHLPACLPAVCTHTVQHHPTFTSVLGPFAFFFFRVVWFILSPPLYVLSPPSKAAPITLPILRTRSPTPSDEDTKERKKTENGMGRVIARQGRFDGKKRRKKKKLHRNDTKRHASNEKQKVNTAP